MKALGMGALFFLSCVLTTTAWAHTTSEAEIMLQRGERQITGEISYTLADLEVAIGLDVDRDGALTKSEFNQRKPAIKDFVTSTLSVDGCQLEAQVPELATIAGVIKARTALNGQCDKQASFRLSYNGMFSLDSNHRALARLAEGEAAATLIFDANNRLQAWPTDSAPLLATTVQYIKEGIWHIWIGFDHILFLLTLLLPAVWLRRRMDTEPTLKEAAVDVAKIVTAFTIAHSITLIIVSAGLIQLESWLVESVIAASVLIAALNNIYPVLTSHRWAVAFGFGLIHGFGFASVLSDLGWNANLMLTSVIGFNVGVELGQLAIVAVALPFLYVVKQTSSRWYRPVVLIGGSTVAVVISLLWVVDRLFGLEFMPI